MQNGVAAENVGRIGMEPGNAENPGRTLNDCIEVGSDDLARESIVRQVAFERSYHGYGVQNFLDIDPHFGTREEFRDFVRAGYEPA